jgi:putative flippase GtrA
MELTPKYEALAAAGSSRGTLWQTLRTRLREHFTLLKFVTMGTIGYIVYQLVFLLFYESSLVWFLPAKGEELSLLAFSHSDARLLITTLVAAELSIAAVFSGHHLWTFRDRRSVEKPIWLRFIQFNGKAAVSSLGLLTLIVNLLTLRVGLTAYLSIPAGVVAVFLWNWLWDSKFIWRPVTRRNEGG